MFMLLRSEKTACNNAISALVSHCPTQVSLGLRFFIYRKRIELPIIHPGVLYENPPRKVRKNWDLFVFVLIDKKVVARKV